MAKKSKWEPPTYNHSDRPIAKPICSKCGVFVADTHIQTHTEWHQKLGL